MRRTRKRAIPGARPAPSLARDGPAHRTSATPFMKSMTPTAMNVRIETASLGRVTTDIDDVERIGSLARRSTLGVRCMR